MPTPQKKLGAIFKLVLLNLYSTPNDGEIVNHYIDTNLVLGRTTHWLELCIGGINTVVQMGRIFFVAAAPDFVYGRVTPELRGNLVSGCDMTSQNWSGEPPFISSATTPMGREHIVFFDQVSAALLR